MMRREIIHRRNRRLGVGRPPAARLSDGRVALRLPAPADTARLAAYGARAASLADGWLPGGPPGPDTRRWARALVAELRAGWTENGGRHGGGLFIDAGQQCQGVVCLLPRGPQVVELTYGVAPWARGQGLATRAVRLAAGWALTDGRFERVELRIGQGHLASQRVAEKAGFRLVERFEAVVKATGDTFVDLLYGRTLTDGPV